MLGPLEASRRGRVLHLGTKKQRAVLAILLLNANRVVPAERLIDELWGDTPPDTARAALQVYVAGLRKALGESGGCLRTSASGYVLDVPPGALDLQRFAALRAEAERADDDTRRLELLREALALWRDAPLADLAAEPFAERAVTGLEEQRLEALELRLEAELRLGRHAALVPELEALVARHPYRERLRAQLMLALYRSGRQADALAVYQAGRRVLGEDLGLRPGPELRELEAAILRQDDGLSLDDRPSANGAIALVPAPRRSQGRRPGTVILVCLGAALAVAVTLAFTLGESTPLTVTPGSVAAIDPRTNEVVAAMQVSERPGAIASGDGALWVANLEDKTVTRIDPVTRRIARTIALPATPTGVEVGLDSVWIAHGRTGQLSRVDPTFNRVARTVDLAGRAIDAPAGNVAVGAGWVWVLFGNSILVRVDPVDMRVTGTTRTAPAAVDVAVGSGSVWVSGSADSSIRRFSPATLDEPLRTLAVGTSPSSITASRGLLWVAITGDDAVARIEADSGSVRTIQVGDGPEGVAVGAGAVWVANRLDGTISRIDPQTSDVSTIHLGNAPAGVTVANGLVWVTVQAP